MTYQQPIVDVLTIVTTTDVVLSSGLLSCFLSAVITMTAAVAEVLVFLTTIPTAAAVPGSGLLFFSSAAAEIIPAANFHPHLVCISEK